MGLAESTNIVREEQSNKELKRQEKILSNFLDNEGKATTIPRKEKNKVILLKHIAKKFSIDKTYTEKEVDEIIKNTFEDYATIRRYMIEYNLLVRTKDGSKYWKK